MVQGVLYCRDDKKLTNAVELCVICQWEWKICGAGTSSIKVAISTWWYWTVCISHPLWGISEGQINAFFFYFFFFLSSIVPLSFVHTVTVCLKVIISWWMVDSFSISLSLSVAATVFWQMLTRNCVREISHLSLWVGSSQVESSESLIFHQSHWPASYYAYDLKEHGALLCC